MHITLTPEQVTHALSVHLCPGAQWVMRGLDLEWLDESQKQPTWGAIDAACHACDPEKEAFKKMTQAQKITFLAKRLGLED